MSDRPTPRTDAVWEAYVTPHSRKHAETPIACLTNLARKLERELDEIRSEGLQNPSNQDSKWRRRIAGEEGHYVNLAGEQYIGFVSTQLAQEMADEIESIGVNRWEEIASRLAYRLVVLLGSQEVVLGKTNGLKMSKDASTAVLKEWKQMGGVMPRFQTESNQQFENE